MNRTPLLVVALVLAIWTMPAWYPSFVSPVAAAPLAANSSATLVLTTPPGLNPPLWGSHSLPVAPDAPRPPRSYLRGPFSEVRIALKRSSLIHVRETVHVINTTVLNKHAIQKLVSAINSIKDRRTVSGVCVGRPAGGRLFGPAWLTFVRADGSTVRAVDNGPGACGGGLTVNGVRGLVDTGSVWNQIISLTRPHRRP